MNGVVFNFARYQISPLDVAVLSDTGVPTVLSDALAGANWNDSMYGGQGNDTLDGDFGNDQIDGGPDSIARCFWPILAYITILPQFQRRNRNWARWQ
jgi:hypothetical protein